MAGGGSYLTGTAENPNATGGMGSGNSDSGQAAYALPYTEPIAADDYYSTMAQPVQRTLDLIYRDALGRAPDEQGRVFWADKATELGWTGQQLAAMINQSGAPERAVTGYQNSKFNPQGYTKSPVSAAPSYYNTNPYAVDYQNIFNPQAGSVLRANPTMTPAQQAQYLTGWQQDYSNRLQRGVADARAQRVANAQAVQADYNTKKAQAEAQAAASNQEAINRAVQEALAQQQASDGYGWISSYSAARGGIASLAKGFKK